MMINIAAQITSFVILIIHSNENSVLSEKIGKCEVRTDSQGTLVAGCIGIGINSIPQNLGGNIEVLDISNNSQMTLNNDDLKNYPNMWAFTMMNINITSIPAGFFQHAKDLRMVNISKTRITNLNEIPSSVIVFNYSYCLLENIELPQLANLQKLYLRKCKNLKKVPIIPISAPLKVIDLKYCILNEANYSQIAPFCRIEYFGFDSVELSIEKHIHQCCGLRKWSRFHHFERSGYIAQECFRDAARPNCSALHIIFDDEAVNAYADCMRPIRRILFFKILAAVIAVIILLFAAILAVHYYHVRKRAKAAAANQEIDALPNEETEAEESVQSTESVQEASSDEG